MGTQTSIIAEHSDDVSFNVYSANNADNSKYYAISVRIIDITAGLLLTLSRAQFEQLFGAMNNLLEKEHAEKLERYAELRSELDHDRLLEGERA